MCLRSPHNTHYAVTEKMNLCTGHNIGTRLLSACLAFGTAIVMLMPKHTVAETETREVSFPGGRQVVQVTDELACDLSRRKDGIVTIYVRRGEEYGVLLRQGGKEYCYLYLEPGRHVLPLSEGSGEYEMIAAEHVQGTSWKVLYDETFTAELTDENEPFRRPDIMVNYEVYSPLTRKAAGLQVAGDDRKTVEKITSWVWRHIRYDWQREKKIRQEHTGLSQCMPDPERTFRERSGVCLDQAALTAAMLRSTGLTARLVFGDHLGKYHAWTEVLTSDGDVIVADATENYTGSGEDYVPEQYY